MNLPLNTHQHAHTHIVPQSLNFRDGTVSWRFGSFVCDPQTNYCVNTRDPCHSFRPLPDRDIATLI
jgi:hypothetical protein